MSESQKKGKESAGDTSSSRRAESAAKPARRGAAWFIAAIFIGQAAYLAGCYLAAWSAAPAARLLVRDSWSPPETAVQVEVRVVRDMPPLLRARDRGLSIALAKDGAEFSSAQTDARGIATFALMSPAAPGAERYDARLAGDRGDDEIEGGGADASASFRLWSSPAATPIAIVTLDSALVFHDIVEGQNARSGSARALDALARDHMIVYLELAPRPDADRSRTRLEIAGLPAGPVANRAVERADAVAAAAQAEVEALRARGATIGWAITSEPRALDGFVAAGVRSLFVGAERPVLTDQRRVFWAEHWTRAAEILASR